VLGEQSVQEASGVLGEQSVQEASGVLVGQGVPEAWSGQEEPRAKEASIQS
jgi:hypothetical protein